MEQLLEYVESSMISALILSSDVAGAIDSLQMLEASSVVKRIQFMLSLAKHYLSSFISFSLVEETVKFITALIVLKMFKIKGVKNYILVFGMIGIGFEIIESLLYVATAGIVAMIFRSIFALHVFFQIWMGLFVYRAHECKELSDVSGSKKNMAIAFFIPVLIHGIHDAGSIASNLSEGHGTAGQMIMVGVLFGCLVMDAAFAIVTLRKALKEIERQNQLTESNLIFLN